MNDTMQKTMTTAANEAKAQFESANKTFESMMNNDAAKRAAEQGAENLRAVAQSWQAVMGEVEQINTGIAHQMGNAFTKAFETQAKMLTSGGWQQAMEIQYAYMNECMDVGFAEISRISDHSTAILTKAAAPLQARFDSTMRQS